MSSTQLFRNYIDIINENSQVKMQLDEGMMDTIKSIVPKAMRFLGGDTIADIANKVKQITGGDYTPNPETAAKVATAFGFDKLVNNQPVAEGIAGNWQGKLLQLMHLAGMGAGAAAAAGMTGDAFSSRPLVGIGFILLLLANTFWSSDKGSVGAMGQHGNQGFSTAQGPTTR